ncbi:FixH family protein [Rhodocyclaceae bacterium SMB388]
MNTPRSDTPDRNAAPRREPAATQARVIAAVVGSLFLVLILGFVAMVFFVQDEVRLNPVGPIAPAPGAERGGLVFRGTANIWDVRGRMTVDAQRNVRFDFDLVGPTGQPAPASLELRLSLDMPEHDMAARALALTRTGVGSYVATASALQPGRWRLRMDFPEIDGVFLFDIDD